MMHIRTLNRIKLAICKGQFPSRVGHTITQEQYEDIAYLLKVERNSTIDKKKKDEIARYAFDWKKAIVKSSDTKSSK